MTRKLIDIRLLLCMTQIEKTPRIEHTTKRNAKKTPSHIQMIHGMKYTSPSINFNKRDFDSHNGHSFLQKNKTDRKKISFDYFVARDLKWLKYSIHVTHYDCCSVQKLQFHYSLRLLFCYIFRKRHKLSSSII